MSVIVAIQNEGVVYMGCDTQTTSGKDKENKIQESTFKITKLSNGVLIGICGKVEAKQRLWSCEDIFKFDGDTLTKKEIVNKIIPKIRKQLSYKEWENCRIDELPISIMLAYKDKLYWICSDYSVIRITDYFSSGSGSDYTCASLADETLPIKGRLLNGLRMSAKRSNSVSNPFVLIDTKKLEYEIVEK